MPPVRTNEHVRRLIAPALFAISEVFAIPTSQILGRRRYSEITRARALLMWIAGARYGVGLAPLGRALRVHHTSVLHARRRMDRELREDVGTKRLLEEVDAVLRRVRRPAGGGA
jgi:chromosomal replication initiation ATPase DnaA